MTIPALWEVCEDAQIESILPIFILDPEIVGDQFEKYGINRIRFLFENLYDLDSQIQSKSKIHFLFSGVLLKMLSNHFSPYTRITRFNYSAPNIVLNLMDENF